MFSFQFPRRFFIFSLLRIQTVALVSRCRSTRIRRRRRWRRTCRHGSLSCCCTNGCPNSSSHSQNANHRLVKFLDIVIFFSISDKHTCWVFQAKCLAIHRSAASEKDTYYVKSTLWMVYVLEFAIYRAFNIESVKF